MRYGKPHAFVRGPRDTLNLRRQLKDPLPFFANLATIGRACSENIENIEDIHGMDGKVDSDHCGGIERRRKPAYAARTCNEVSQEMGPEVHMRVGTVEQGYE